MSDTSNPTGDCDIDRWQRVLEDDTGAFEEVVVKYQSLIAAVAYSATGNFSLSEEVTQETFLASLETTISTARPSALGSLVV